MSRYQLLFIILAIAAMQIPGAHAKRMRNMLKSRSASASSKQSNDQSSSVSSSVDTQSDLVQKNTLHAYMEPINQPESATYAGITIVFDEHKSEMMNINYFIADGPKHCKDCFIAIHDGHSCDHPGDSLFSSTAKKNPWSRRGGASVQTNAKGKGVSTIASISNGLNIEDNAGRVIMIHNGADNVVACGILESAQFLSNQ